ncbi:MAG: pyruvate,orthophosphate dikinase, partial [Candidatus Poriferisodalaceae bacterium]
MAISVVAQSPGAPNSDAEHTGSIGRKAQGLVELAELGLPVPAAFVLHSDAHVDWLANGWTNELDAAIGEAITDLEGATGRTFGSDASTEPASAPPLLVSVRPSPLRSTGDPSLVGIAGPILNVGLTAAVAQVIAERYDDERYALHSRRAFIEHYSTAVSGVDREPYEACLTQALALADVSTGGEVPADLLRYVCERFEAIHLAESGHVFPEDPHTQLRAVIEAAFASWNSPEAQAQRNRAGSPGAAGMAVI